MAGHPVAGLVYVAAIALFFLVMLVYVPVLSALGVPDQVAATAAGVGTLVVIAAVIAKVVRQPTLQVHE